MKVIRASWLKSPKAREGKTHSSLILSVQGAQQVRDLVKNGLVVRAVVRLVEHLMLILVRYQVEVRYIHTAT